MTADRLAAIAYAVLLAVGSVLVLVAAGTLVVRSWRDRERAGRSLAARLSARQAAGALPADRTRAAVRDLDVVVLLGAYGLALLAHWAISAARGSTDLAEAGQQALLDGVIATAAVVVARTHAPLPLRRWPGVRRGWAAYLLAVALAALGALAALAA